MKILYMNKSNKESLLKCHCSTLFRVEDMSNICIKCPCEQCVTSLRFLSYNYKRRVSK